MNLASIINPSFYASRFQFSIKSFICSSKAHISKIGFSPFDIYSSHLSSIVYNSKSWNPLLWFMNPIVQEIQNKLDNIKSSKEIAAAYIGILVENSQNVIVSTERLRKLLQVENNCTNLTPSTLSATKILLLKLEKSIIALQTISDNISQLSFDFKTDDTPQKSNTGRISLSVPLNLYDLIQDRKHEYISTSFDSTKYPEIECYIKSVNEVYRKTQIIIDKAYTFPNHLESICSHLGIPSTSVRLWFPSLLTLYCGHKMIHIYLANSDNFSKSVIEFKETISSFFVQWVIEPLRTVYRTIRHRESRLAIMGSQSLECDIDSLERMVLEFAKDHGIGSEQVSQVIESLHQGDMSIVLQSYEQDMKSPLKTAVTGMSSYYLHIYMLNFS